MANIFDIDLFNFVKNLTPHFWREDNLMDIEDGDFKLRQSDDQNLEAIIIANKGQFYESPLLGYGINKRINSPFITIEEKKDIRENLKRDNYDVITLTIDRQTFEINLDAVVSGGLLSFDIFLVKNELGGESNLIAYLRSIAKPIQDIADNLLILRNETVTFLDYNGQHGVLEEYLNDLYDPSLRRIFITENNNSNQLFIIDFYLQGETDPSPTSIYLQGEIDPTPFSLYKQGEVVSVNNFTINVPVAVTFDPVVMTAQVKNYSKATKTFDIVTF